MSAPKTRFGHIYGYGLLVLWATTSLFIVGALLAESWPDLGEGLTISFFFALTVTVIGLPVAAIASFVIGGITWNFLINSVQSRSLRSGLAGGTTGGLVGLFMILGNIDSLGLLGILIILGLFLLGLWCGWAGERLARRHVRVDPRTVGTAFD